MKQMLEKEKKPLIHVGAIGHMGDGKTTLAIALTRLSAERFESEYGTYDDVADGMASITAFLKYESESRCYVHRDWSGYAEYARDLIAGMAQIDGVILVCSAQEGPMPQTRESVLLARSLGVPALVVFLSKADLVDDDELIDLVELEVRVILSTYGFAGDDTPVVRGSALAALAGDRSDIGIPAIERLVEALDRYVPEPVRAVDQPFLMAVEDVFEITGRGTVATGRVERGKVKVGDEIEIAGTRQNELTTVMAVEAFRKMTDRAQAGDLVGLVLRDVKVADLERGQVLCRPGSITSHAAFEAQVHVRSNGEGARKKPFFKAYRPRFYFRSKEVDGLVELPPGVEMMLPGDNVTARVSLAVPVAMERGTRFAIREAGIAVAFADGVVLRVFDGPRFDPIVLESFDLGAEATPVRTDLAETAKRISTQFDEDSTGRRVADLVMRRLGTHLLQFDVIELAESLDLAGERDYQEAISALDYLSFGRDAVLERRFRYWASDGTTAPIDIAPAAVLDALTHGELRDPRNGRLVADFEEHVTVTYHSRMLPVVRR